MRLRITGVEPINCDKHRPHTLILESTWSLCVSLKDTPIGGPLLLSRKAFPPDPVVGTRQITTT